MENNGKRNEKGSATIESSIVLPIIIILISVFLVAFIAMFEFSYGVIDLHEQDLQMEESDQIKVAFNMFGYSMNQSYHLSDKKMSAKTLQRLIELLITLFDDYNERIKLYEDKL